MPASTQVWRGPARSLAPACTAASCPARYGPRQDKEAGVRAHFPCVLSMRMNEQQCSAQASTNDAQQLRLYRHVRYGSNGVSHCTLLCATGCPAHSDIESPAPVMCALQHTHPTSTQHLLMLQQLHPLAMTRTRYLQPQGQQQHVTQQQSTAIMQPPARCIVAQPETSLNPVARQALC